MISRLLETGFPAKERKGKMPEALGSLKNYPRMQRLLIKWQVNLQRKYVNVTQNAVPNGQSNGPDPIKDSGG